MALTDYPELHEAFLWIEKKFKDVNHIPKGVLNFVECLAKASPTCSYLPPTEECFSLVTKLFEKDAFNSSELLLKINNKLPMFFGLIRDLKYENRLPGEMKSLVYHLISLSRKPFTGPTRLTPLLQPVNDTVSCFPMLPAVRERGHYAMDIKRDEPLCQKNYSSHKKLTAGIFTVYCPHGNLLYFLIFVHIEA